MRPLHKVQQNGGRKAKVLGRKLQNSVTPARRAPCSLAGHNFGQPSHPPAPSPTFHKCIFKYPTAAKLSCIFAVFMRLLTLFSSLLLQMVTRTKKIFVGGLSAPTTLEDVKSYFEQFGPVSTSLFFNIYLYIFTWESLYICIYREYLPMSVELSDNLRNNRNSKSCKLLPSLLCSPLSPAHCTPTCSS